MTINCPLHQRRKWQHDESREQGEQNSFSEWNLASSKSQTTCEERDSPLSSANAYISKDTASPWASSQTSTDTDTLWLGFLLFFFLGEDLCSLSRPMCASRLSVVHIAEDIKAHALFEEGATHTHTVNKHILTHKDFTCNAYFAFSSYHSLCEGKRWLDISQGMWSGADARPQACPLGSDPSVVLSVSLNSPTMQSISRSHTPQLSKQLERIKRRGWNTFSTCSDNGKSCLAIVFCRKKGVL